MSDVPERTAAYYREPKPSRNTITFVASRLKLSVVPILITPFPLFAIPPLRLTLRLAEQGHAVAMALIVFGGLFLVSSGLVVFLGLSLIFPARNIVTTVGCSTVSLGRTTTYRWSDYLEAKEGRVSNGRSLQPCITLKPKDGSKPVNLLTGAYPNSLYDLVQVFKHAQSGRLIDPDDAAFPWAYLLA